MKKTDTFTHLGIAKGRFPRKGQVKPMTYKIVMTNDPVRYTKRFFKTHDVDDLNFMRLPRPMTKDEMLTDDGVIFNMANLQ